METLQYVGARYIPKFATPYEWDINATYEALTIVGYMGNSYTSKIPVPAGTQISDEKYWALTNAQSGQVSDLAQRMTSAESSINGLTDKTNTLETDITNIYDTIADNSIKIAQNTKDIAANKKAISDIQNNIHFTGTRPQGMKNVIFIGDSYAAHSPGWQEYLPGMCGLSASEYAVGAAGGKGYVVNAGVSFLTLLKGIVESKGEDWCSNVTHIIVGLAGNDYKYSKELIEAAIDEFAAYWKVTFPNANCYNMCVGRCIADDWITAYKSNCYANINNRCAMNGMNVPGGVEAAVYRKEWMADTVHPNATGYQQCAAVMYNALLNGCVQICSTSNLFNATTMSGFTDDQEYFYEYIRDGWYCLGNNGVYGRKFKYTLSTPVTTSGIDFEIGNFDSAFITGSKWNRNIQWRCTAVDSAGGTHDAYCVVVNNTLYCGTYETITGLQAVYIFPFNVTQPLISC